MKIDQEILEIESVLKKGGATPRELAEFKVSLAGWSSYYLGQIEEIESRRPATWQAIRAHSECKSDKSADRAYEGTEDGLALNRLESWVKRTSMMVSSINSLINVATYEIRNQI